MDGGKETERTQEKNDERLEIMKYRILENGRRKKCKSKNVREGKEDCQHGVMGKV